ncbi:restriction endonuclease subunit S [Elizabethkingia anophelis]|nr:restriction endonuclease subunit S [Elizabethkingia anophelis]
MRFPSFEGEWETKKLGDLCKIYDGTHQTPNYVESGIPFYSVEHITSNNFDKTKYISEEVYEKEIKRVKIEGGDILMTRIGDIGTSKYIDWNVKASFYVSLALIKQSSHINSKYLNQFISTDFFQKELWHRTIHVAFPKKINLGEIDNCIVNYPSNSEQKKISDFLSLLDERILTQSKIIKELNVLKTTITKRIFSGQLRFKNASGDNYEDWKTKKLGDVTTLINKRNKNNEKLPVYSINNKLGFVPQSEQFEGVDSEDRGYDITLYKIIDKNTFAYNPARINVGSIGYSGNLENIIISSLYVCFKTEEFVNDNFLFQYLKTDFFNKEVLRNVEGGVRDYLFYENFARIKFDLPCVEEQRKIADYLSSIDLKVDIEIQILNKLEEQKKFLLQQMFV